MDENKVVLAQLANNWMTLSKEIKRRKFSFEMFCDTFSKTFELLSAKATESCIEKSFLSVIVNAYLFAHAEVSDNLESRYKAALVLTERMLETVTAEGTGEACDEAVVYILESRKGININFKDIDGAIEELTKVFEADYWNSINR